MKNIVLCSDGTWNHGGKGDGTNVWRLYNLVDHRTHEARTALPRQVATYDDGVGTEDFKLLKIVGGVFGWGLSRNARQLYKFLVRNYEPGDRIFLFGFSRGAFTVRTLAGLIDHVGIIDASRITGEDREERLQAAVDLAWEAYRAHRRRDRRFRSFAFGVAHGSGMAEHFRATYSHPDRTIRFIGVWDTVSALGGPFEWFKDTIEWFGCLRFHDYGLGDHIEYAYHALALDEERAEYRPMLWDETANGGPDRKLRAVRQVWFAGAHSNVGGGYPKQEIAAVSLAWMMEKAHRCGLRFEAGALDEVRASMNPHGKLYDSRSGLGAYFRPEPRAISDGQRWRKSPLAESYRDGVPLVHVSVLERIREATQGYAPRGLPTRFRVDVSGARPLHDTMRVALVGWSGTGKADGGGVAWSKPGHDAIFATGCAKSRRLCHTSLVVLTVFVVGALLVGLSHEGPAPDSLLGQGLGGAVRIARWFVPAGFLDERLSEAQTWAEANPVGTLPFLFGFLFAIGASALCRRELEALARKWMRRFRKGATHP